MSNRPMHKAVASMEPSSERGRAVVFASAHGHAQAVIVSDHSQPAPLASSGRTLTRSTELPDFSRLADAAAGWLGRGSTGRSRTEGR